MQQPDYQLYAAAFGLLHRPFLSPPEEAWLTSPAIQSAFQAWPFPLSASTAEAVADALKQESAESITRDHYRLFIGPGPMKSPPNGSVYTDRENLLYGQTTVEFDAFCQQHGIKLEHQEGAACDHIGLMLGLLAHLLEHRQDLVAPLLENHLLPWSERLLELAIQEASSAFYRRTALLCSETLNQLALELTVTFKPRELFY